MQNPKFNMVWGGSRADSSNPRSQYRSPHRNLQFDHHGYLGILRELRARVKLSICQLFERASEKKQLKALVFKSKLDVETECLNEICNTLHKFLMPLVVSISNQIKFIQNWVQPGIWKVNQIELT
ncbi:MAG: hypothetical protein EBT92_17425 [Planctomycetes bacterium]|nr:hypothetical protein [Planctomycetota bacterium]